jgi:hypothetical protein
MGIPGESDVNQGLARTFLKEPIMLTRGKLFLTENRKSPCHTHLKGWLLGKTWYRSKKCPLLQRADEKLGRIAG